jgi:hypothetical protein
MKTTKYGTIQRICPGGNHDGVDPDICPGGEWRDFMSMGWFYDRPAEAVGIFRQDPLMDKKSVRLVLHTHTEEVLDL